MSFTYALGWTLLHSLWQGLILGVLAIIALRIIPSRYSSARYIVSTATLALMLISSIGTFTVLQGQARVTTMPELEALTQSTAVLIADHTPASSGSLVDRFYNFIQLHLQLITLAWVFGVLVFSLRIAGGFWYLSRIRHQAEPVAATWVERLQQLGARLGIDRVVMLAESAQVQAPVVMGYLKPVILLPVGMIGGLSTEQLETILLHELSHIRRADYLVNIIQSFIEALFFFNPFVWIVSAMVRTEREHCCDDAVVQHGHALAYAHALASVEALRLNNTSLALSLAGDKNQLLKRIKRIMEKSVQHYSVKERIVPVVLLVVGLACASWMTLKPEQRKASENGSREDARLAADTTKPGEKSASYSRKRIIRIDENGKPHEKVIENFEGDEELREQLSHEERFEALEELEHLMINVPEFHGFEAPMAIQVPGIEFQAFDIPVIVEVPHFEPFEPMEITMPPMPPMMIWNGSDTLKPGSHTFYYSDGSEKDWEKFSADFQERFKGQFADFYKEHGPEMDAMMKEMAQNFNHNFNYTFDKSFERAEWGAQEAERAVENAERARARAEKHREAMEHDRERMDKDRARMGREANRMSDQARQMEEKMAKFDEALKAELVKDGYIKADETIDSVKWETSGNVIINGKKIKNSDRPKYNAIHDKFFKEDSIDK
jgi:bla regulator protein blaR1